MEKISANELVKKAIQNIDSTVLTELLDIQKSKTERNTESFFPGFTNEEALKRALLSSNWRIKENHLLAKGQLVFQTDYLIGKTGSEIVRNTILIVSFPSQDISLQNLYVSNVKIPKKETEEVKH